MHKTKLEGGPATLSFCLSQLDDSRLKINHGNLHEVFVLRLGKVSIGEGMDFSQSKMQVYLILATMCSDTEPSCVLDLDIIITSLAHHNCVAHPSQLCRVVLKVDQAIGVGYLLEADRATGSTYQ